MPNNELKSISHLATSMYASDNSERSENIFLKNYINHQEPDAEGGISDKRLEAWKTLVSDYHEAISECGVHVLRQLAENDAIAIQWG